MPGVLVRYASVAQYVWTWRRRCVAQLVRGVLAASLGAALQTAQLSELLAMRREEEQQPVELIPTVWLLTMPLFASQAVGR